MYEEGYIISVYGTTHLKKTTFSKQEPTAEELDFIVKDAGGIEAYVSKGSFYSVKESYQDQYSNVIKMR